MDADSIVDIEYIIAELDAERRRQMSENPNQLVIEEYDNYTPIKHNIEEKKPLEPIVFDI